MILQAGMYKKANGANCSLAKLCSSAVKVLC